MPASSNPPEHPKGAARRVRPVPAVSRALAILRLLGNNPEPMTLKSISDELGLIASTGLHILRVLVDEGMVKVDATTKRYSLDVGMLALARSVAQNNPFTTRVQPLLDRIAVTWNVTTIGVKVTGTDDLIVLALARSSAPFRLYVEVGSRFPALTSATGRLVAAHSKFTNSELTKRFKHLPWDVAPDFDTWRTEVEEAGHKGFAIDKGNYISGITVVAVPVFDVSQHMTHAVVAVGVSDQLSGTRARDLANDLLDASRVL